MQIFAHRGASGEYPENTLLAMEQAIEQGADGIEFDVQQAKDNLAVTHDRYIKAPHGMLHIASTSMHDLQQIPLPQGQFIPTLDQVMQCINGRCLANIELKTLSQFDVLKEVLNRSLTHYQFAPEQIIVSSFNHHLLREVHKWDTGVQIGALTASLPLRFSKFALEMNANAVHADINALDLAFVEDAHQQQLPIRVFTVDHPEEILRLASWGVDAIFTNYPAFAKQLLTAKQATAS